MFGLFLFFFCVHFEKIRIAKLKPEDVVWGVFIANVTKRIILFVQFILPFFVK